MPEHSGCGIVPCLVSSVGSCREATIRSNSSVNRKFGLLLPSWNALCWQNVLFLLIILGHMVFKGFQGLLSGCSKGLNWHREAHVYPQDTFKVISAPEKDLPGCIIIGIGGGGPFWRLRPDIGFRLFSLADLCAQGWSLKLWGSSNPALPESHDLFLSVLFSFAACGLWIKRMAIWLTTSPTLRQI